MVCYISTIEKVEKKMKILAILCYVFAVIDFAGMFLGYDITGVFWSPIVAAVVGNLLMKVANKKEAEIQEEVGSSGAEE